jgi:hypothetical protein
VRHRKARGRVRRAKNYINPILMRKKESIGKYMDFIEQM